MLTAAQLRSGSGGTWTKLLAGGNLVNLADVVETRAIGTEIFDTYRLKTKTGDFDVFDRSKIRTTLFDKTQLEADYRAAMKDRKPAKVTMTLKMKNDLLSSIHNTTTLRYGSSRIRHCCAALSRNISLTHDFDAYMLDLENGGS
jgi:hypothetical protein